MKQCREAIENEKFSENTARYTYTETTGLKTFS